MEVFLVPNLEALCASSFWVFLEPSLHRQEGLCRKGGHSLGEGEELSRWTRVWSEMAPGLGCSSTKQLPLSKVHGSVGFAKQETPTVQKPGSLILVEGAAQSSSGDCPGILLAPGIPG